MDGNEELEQVLAHLLARAEMSATRSSGAGGQHRDKASTRAELALDAGALEGLPEGVVARLMAGLGLDRKPLRIEVEEQRYLSVNREIALARLRELVVEALKPPPPQRRKTRPRLAARTARMDEKRQRGDIKRMRRPPEA